MKKVNLKRKLVAGLGTMWLAFTFLSAGTSSVSASDYETGRGTITFDNDTYDQEQEAEANELKTIANSGSGTTTGTDSATESKASSSKENLPATGENSTQILMVLGGLIVIGAISATVVLKRRKK